jgi:hypothetical protein
VNLLSGWIAGFATAILPAQADVPSLSPTQPRPLTDDSRLGVISAQKIDSLTTALFDKAHEINGLRSPTQWRQKDHEPAGRSADEIIELLRVIVTGEEFADEHLPPASARSDRGSLLAQSFGDLAARYPFAAEAAPGEDVSLSFSTEADVRSWLDSLKEAARKCDVLLKVGLPKMEELVNAGVGDTLAKLNEVNPNFIPPPADDFAHFASRVTQISEETRAVADQLDRYRSRLPSRGFVVTTLVVTSLVFASGVVYPMIDTRALTPAVAGGVLYDFASRRVCLHNPTLSVGKSYTCSGDARTRVGLACSSFFNSG